MSIEILKKCYDECILQNFIINTNNPEFYKKLRFKAYYIKDINDNNIDKNQLFVNCNFCNKRAKKLSNWVFKNKKFCADFYCKKCDNKFKGYISFRKFYDRVDIRKKAICIKKQK